MNVSFISERLRCNFNDLHLGTKYQLYTGVLMCAIKIAILLPTAISFVLKTHICANAIFAVLKRTITFTLGL